MHTPLPLRAGLVLLAALAPAATQTAAAQTVATAPARHPPPLHATHASTEAIPLPPLPPGPPTTTVPPAVLPVVPMAPPPPPVIPPPLVVPTRAMPPPLPATITPDAPGDATPIPGGIRITFAADGSDLNPATAAAIRTLASTAPPGARIAIDAYARPAADDPSTPRRLSLARALAVRSVLIGEGVASPRIFPKALGGTAAGSADGPADRADITVTTPAPTASPPPASTPPASTPAASPHAAAPAP